MSIHISSIKKSGKLSFLRLVKVFTLVGPTPFIQLVLHSEHSPRIETMKPPCFYHKTNLYQYINNDDDDIIMMRRKKVRRRCKKRRGKRRGAEGRDPY